MLQKTKNTYNNNNNKSAMYTGFDLHARLFIVYFVIVFCLGFLFRLFWVFW